MSKPSPAFAAAYAGAVGSVGVQLARQPSIASKMSSAAIVFAAAVAVGLAGVPQSAQAENLIKRTAIDTFAGIAGAAVGSQIGGGRGKDLATAAGAAAGVWIAESMQEDGHRTDSNGRSRTYSSGGNANFGPTNWVNSSASDMQPVRQSARQATRVNSTNAQPSRWTYVNAADSDRAARPVGLVSGATDLTRDRRNKLQTIEMSFLKARDAYAKALFAAEQSQDDAVLEPGDRSVARAAERAKENTVVARHAYEQVRETFVGAVDHMGARGYNVLQFAYTHRLAGTAVTSDEMSRGALAMFVGADSLPRESDADRVEPQRYR